MSDLSHSHPSHAANPVRWFEIYVEDMPRARRFYEAVFKNPCPSCPLRCLNWKSMPFLANTAHKAQQGL
jgi:hypothetical protein